MNPDAKITLAQGRRKDGRDCMILTVEWPGGGHRVECDCAPDGAMPLRRVCSMLFGMDYVLSRKIAPVVEVAVPAAPKGRST